MRSPRIPVKQGLEQGQVFRGLPNDTRRIISLHKYGKVEKWRSGEEEKRYQKIIRENW
jgi:hypothetical protein